MDCCHLKISSTSYFSPSFHVESTTPTGFVSLITHHVYLSPPWKVLEILATLASSHGNVFRQSLVRRKYRYERRTECFSLINRQFEEFYKNKGWYNWINFMPFLLSKNSPTHPSPDSTLVHSFQVARGQYGGWNKVLRSALYLFRFWIISR